MLEKFDFSPGKIVTNNLVTGDDMTLNNRNTYLSEDMFHVVYPNNYILDVGWYRGVKKLIINVVKDCDWHNPIIKEYCKDWDELDEKIVMCLKQINELINNIENQ
jgi:hypothetical protein